MTLPAERPTAGYAVEMSARCYLGHGASGTAASMAPFVDGLRARGVDATAIDLPKRKAEDALPAFHLVVPSEADVAIGGHSFGGRVASLAAAEPGAPYAALVLLQLPAPPARLAGPDRCPDRALAGDPLPGPAPVGRVGSVRPDRPPAADVAKLPHGELVTYPRLGHTLKPVLDDALDRTAAFLLAAAGR